SRAKLGDRAEREKTSGYLRIHLCGKEIYAHRAAWAHHYGELPEKMVDHINGIKGDNRIENLRLADLAENNWNWRGRASASGASQYKRTGLWSSKINHRGKVIYIGCFKTKAEAQEAYQAAAQKLRGEFHVHKS